MARLTAADLDIERGDAFEYETEDGTVFRFVDPRGIALRKLIELENLAIEDQLQAMLGDRFDEFADKPDVDGYVFEAILKAYYQHCGMGDPGEALASSRSLNGTARRSKPTSRSVASTSGRSSGNGRSAKH